MNLGPISTGTKNRDIKVAIYIENSNDTEVLSWMYCHWSIFSRMTNINTCNCWNEHKPHQESSVHHLYNVISDSLGLLGSHRNQSLTFLIHEKCKILWARCGGSRDLLLKFRDKLGFELRSKVPLQAGKYQVWSHCGGGWKAGSSTQRFWEAQGRGCVGTSSSLSSYRFLNAVHVLPLYSRYHNISPPSHLPIASNTGRKLELLSILVNLCL